MRLFLQRFKTTVKELLEYIVVYWLDCLVNLAKSGLSLMKMVLFIICLVSLPLWCVPANILQNRKVNKLEQDVVYGRRKQNRLDECDIEF